MTTGEDTQHEILRKIIAEVSRVVIGKNEVKELLLVALLSQGHVLIEGLPGTAKTTLARTFAQVIGGKFKRVQGTPDMLPADILGFYLYRTDGSATFMPGPIFANVVLADELNRTTPRTQAALLEAMQEQQVTIERETHPIEKPFIVIASQTPYGGVGTSPLSDVQIDRFIFRLWSGFPSVEEEQYVLRNIDHITEARITPVATLADVMQLQQAVKKVYVADNISRYIVEVLNRLRQHQDLVVGPSPRGSIALFRGARAVAFTQSRDFVIPDDVKRLLIPALSHRLRLTAEAEMEKVTPETIINQVANEVPVPKEETGVAAPKGEAVNRDEETAAPAMATPVTLTPAAAAPTEVDEANPEMAKAEPVADKVEDVPVPAEKTREKAVQPTGRKITTWEWVVILCALAFAAAMISLGLLSIR